MDNTLGSVYIEIRGDLSKLQGDFASAEALAVRAGTGMSQGLNQASVGADKVVFAIGRLAGVVEQQSAQMSLAFQRNIATLANFEQGAGRAEQGIRKVGTASEGTVPQMAAVSGAIRTAFGEQSIRAVERFLTLIPGVGAALQFAFPVIGAIALYEAISRVLDKSDQLKAAEKELADAVTQTDNAMREQSQTVDRIRAKSIGREFGPAAEQEAQARAMRQQALDYYEDINKLTAANKQAVVDYAAAHPMRAPLSMDDWDRLKQVPEVQAKIQANEEKIDELTAKSTAKIAEAYDLMAQSARTRSEEGGKLGAAQAAASLSRVMREAEAEKAAARLSIDLAHETAEGRIRAIDDAGERGIAEAKERIRTAQATEAALTAIIATETAKRVALIRAAGADEAAGKSTYEQKKIGIETGAKVSAAQDEGERERKTLHADTLKAMGAEDEAYSVAARGWLDSVTKAWEEQADRIHKARVEGKDLNSRAFVNAELPGVYNREAETKASGIAAKGAGEAKELDIERQKIALEGQYAQTIFKTGAGEVAYLQQIAKLDKEAADAKIDGLKADLAIAQSEAEAVKGTEAYVAALEKVARLKVQIANAQGESANQQGSDANQIGIAQKKSSLKDQIGSDAHAGLSSLSGALAKGVLEGGKSIGKDIKASLTNIGKEMLGDVIKKGTEELILAILSNTVATNLNTIVTAVKALFGFAEGTASAPGGMAMVGERGPELMYVPRGAQIIPNHRLGHFADGVGSTSSFSSSVQANHFHGPMHFHGVQSVDGMMREIALRAKTATPGNSKYAR